MKRPVLCIQTIYFGESDRGPARRLGRDLYNLLTRPVDAPLGNGPGIPVLEGVHVDKVDVGAADTVVLIPTLGKTSFGLHREVIIEKLRIWHDQLGAGHVLPVPLSANWRSVESDLPGKLLLTELYGTGDRRKQTLDEIVIAAIRLLDGSSDLTKLFISHAKADLADTQNAAKAIRDFAATDTTLKTFFDANDLRAGEPLAKQLERAVSRGIVLVVRSDAYASRAWCQAELLEAKKSGIPVVTLEVLREGEPRSYPYGGNVPSVVWKGNPADVFCRAMVERLRWLYFEREGERVIEAAGLPQGTVQVAPRPPELLDLAQGPLYGGQARLVLHPDPELAAQERAVLAAACPRLRLATPTTAYRQLLTRDDAPPEAASPLEGWQVALSLSDIQEGDRDLGFNSRHLVDAALHLSRCLVSSGAALAYGGDFRTARAGDEDERVAFTPLLAGLIQAYEQTASVKPKYLHSYIAAILRPEDAPDDLALKMLHLSESPEVAQDAILPRPSGDPTQNPPPPLYFSDMRRVMAMHTQARVILGGKTTPKLGPDEEGYGGLYPGVVEEAWRTLEERKPLYVLGGYGGAARLVADLAGDGPVPDAMEDATWASEPFYTENAHRINACPSQKALGLPRNMAVLADAIHGHLHGHLADDASSLAWNGLTVEENRTLFGARDPVTLAALVLKGLLAKAREGAHGKLPVELSNNSITTADPLDVIAVAVLEDIPLGGAGAALDKLLGGQLTAAKATGTALIGLNQPGIAADWLYLASLGAVLDPESLADRVERAARRAAAAATRYGFRRIGVVTFGAGLDSRLEQVVPAMLRGLGELPGGCAVTWFELDQGRFEKLHKLLANTQGLSLSTIRAKGTALPATAKPRPEPVQLVVTLNRGSGELTSSPILPSGPAASGLHSHTITAAQLGKLSAGVGSAGRRTPPAAELHKRGVELAGMLLGDHADEILAKVEGVPWRVVHDREASRIPFELIRRDDADAVPAVATSGFSRQLILRDLPAASYFLRPSSAGKIRVLLVVNPTRDLPDGDLPGAEAEATEIRRRLGALGDTIDLVELPRPKTPANRGNVRRELEHADILHYCGHAFYDGPGPKESGLWLDGKAPAGSLLTGADLAKLTTLPRMAFVNACEAGRVRGKKNADLIATAFAEVFLRSGVEAFLGTYWQVGDAAAATFAAAVYGKLAEGRSLAEAVRHARQDLRTRGERDWANYLLYGGTAFRLAENRPG